MIFLNMAMSLGSHCIQDKRISKAPVCCEAPELLLENTFSPDTIYRHASL